MTSQNNGRIIKKIKVDSPADDILIKKKALQGIISHLFDNGEYLQK